MKKQIKKLRSQKGFTLIEILVVIAIIGILASVVIAVMGNSRDKARAASAMTSMKSMINAAQLASDSTGRFPEDLCVSQGLIELPDWGHLGYGTLQKLSQAVCR